MTKAPITMPSFIQEGGAGNPRRRRWLSGAIVTAMAAALVVLPVGAASAAPDGDTEAEVVVTAGIALVGLPAGFNLTGQPGDLATEAEFDYTVVTNSTTGYNVTVQADAATLVGDDQLNTDTIPIARLGARDDAPVSPAVPGLYTPLSSTTPVNVHTQVTRSATDGDPLSTGFQMLIPAVAADTYTVTLSYLAAVI